MAADDVTLVEGKAEAPAPEARRPIGMKAYEGRFSVAYLALAVVVAGAVIALAIVLKEPAKNSGPRWSAWRPTASGLDQARQIADHVGTRYRAPNGEELVTNLVTPFEINQVPLSGIAVRNGTSTRDVQFFDYSFPRNVPYTMCGLGNRCSILNGKPSRPRGRLIRREALELALYTFKYVRGAQSVIAYVPPAPGYQLTNVIFLRRSELEGALARPLGATLPGQGPFQPSSPLRDSPALDEMLQEHLFRTTYTQLPNGSALVVLTPRELQS